MRKTTNVQSKQWHPGAELLRLYAPRAIAPTVVTGNIEEKTPLENGSWLGLRSSGNRVDVVN